MWYGNFHNRCQFWTKKWWFVYKKKKNNWLHFCEIALWKFLFTRVSQLRYRDGVDFFQWCLPSILATEPFIICLFVKFICLNSFNKYTVYLFLNGDWTFWIFKLIRTSFLELLFSTWNFKNLIDENSIMYMKCYGCVTVNWYSNMPDLAPRMKVGMLSLHSFPPSSILRAQ